MPVNCIAAALLRSGSSDAYWAQLRAAAEGAGLCLSALCLQPMVTFAEHAAPVEGAAPAPARGTKGMSFAGAKRKREADVEAPPASASAAATAPPPVDGPGAGPGIIRLCGIPILLRSEDDIFSALNMLYVPPSERPAGDDDKRADAAGGSGASGAADAV